MHEACGKTHRTPEAQEACEQKYARAAARLAKRDAEVARRQAVADALPPQQFVVKRRALGWTWDKIVAGLKKDYPEPWNVWQVAEAYAETLNWPMSIEAKTQLLLERYYVGDFLTTHPLDSIGGREGMHDLGALVPEDLDVIADKHGRFQDEQFDPSL